MRISFLLMIVTLLSSLAYAQTETAAGASDVKIVKHSWEKLKINWETDPFALTNGEGYLEMRLRVYRERRPRSALEERSIQEAKNDKKPPKPPRYIFMYKLTVDNVGAKAIKEMDWDYIFSDRVTGEILGRREFTSDDKIGPGKRKELIVTVPNPPTQRVSVYALGKDEHAGIAESIEIVRILYEDNTVWAAARPN